MCIVVLVVYDIILSSDYDAEAETGLQIWLDILIEHACCNSRLYSGTSICGYYWDLQEMS